MLQVFAAHQTDEDVFLISWCFFYLHVFLSCSALSSPGHHNKRSNSWKCTSEQKTNHEVKGMACRAERQHCVETHVWGRLQKMFCCPEGSQKHVASIILLWKKFGTTRTPAGLLARLSNRWRRALVRLVTKNPMVTLADLHDHMWRWGKLTEGHHYNTPQVWALWLLGQTQASSQWRYQYPYWRIENVYFVKFLFCESFLNHNCTPNFHKSSRL